MIRELYVLSSDRSAGAVGRFLDRFLPSRRSLSADFPIPESTDRKSTVLASDCDLLEYLESSQEEPYGVYWADASGESGVQAMAFYTRDGMVILGLCGDFDDALRTAREVADFVGARYSRVVDEERPPDTAAAFISLCTLCT